MPPNEWTRVIVLIPPSAPDGAHAFNGQLKSLFASRDWFALEQNDPCLAMAELCLREKAQVTRSAWGLQRMEQLALMILEANRWPRLNELVEAVRRYVPTATIWTTVDNEIVALRTDVDDAASAAGSLRFADAVQTAPAPAGRRQSNAADPPAESDLAEKTVNALETQRISPEEIDMLLNNGDDDAAPTDRSKTLPGARP